jgi:hypothetical protein
MSDAPPKPDEPHGLGHKYDFEAEFMGETLHYIELGRRTSMIWTWTTGYRISTDSLTDWTFPDGTRRPLTEAERAEIVRRAVQYAREVQHVHLIVEP